MICRYLLALRTRCHAGSFADVSAGAFNSEGLFLLSLLPGIFFLPILMSTLTQVALEDTMLPAFTTLDPPTPSTIFVPKGVRVAVLTASVHYNRTILHVFRAVSRHMSHLSLSISNGLSRPV